jgi:RNA polymerase sigma factor (sigma-70 family)
MTDDAELLRRYAEARSEEAFTALVERHLGLVYHAALRRTGRTQLAEEAAQYVFITLSRNAAALSRHAVLTGWLYTTTRFAANRIVRTERRRQLREQEAYAMQNTLAPPDADWDRIRPALDGVMDQLPERDRTAVLLRYFEGRSFAEVGAALRLTEDAARKRVERGVDRLRGLLAQRGITSTSAALALVLSGQAALAAPAGLASAVTGAALAASGSVATSTVVVLLQLMSTTKAILGIAGVLGLLALGTAGYEFNAGRQAEASLATETRDLDVQSKHLRALAAQAELVEKSVADLRRMANGFSSGASSSPRWDSRGEGRKFLAAHPEARPLLEQVLRNYVAVRYGPFLRSLGLAPAQIEQIESRLMETDPGIVIPSKSGDPLDFSLTDNAPQSKEEMQDQMREAMGDSIYQQFRSYASNRDRLNGAQMVADRVASDTYFTATPLTGNQAGQLLQILANNNPNYQNGGTTNQMASFDWDAVLSQAKEVLSPAQLSSLESFQAMQAYQTALQAAQQRTQPSGQSSVP